MTIKWSEAFAPVFDKMRELRDQNRCTLCGRSNADPCETCARIIRKYSTQYDEAYVGANNMSEHIGRALARNTTLERAIASALEALEDDDLQKAERVLTDALYDPEKRGPP